MWVYLPGLNTGLAALKLGIGEGWAGIPIPGNVVFGEITGIVGDPEKKKLYIYTCVLLLNIVDCLFIYIYINNQLCKNVFGK